MGGATTSAIGHQPQLVHGHVIRRRANSKSVKCLAAVDNRNKEAVDIAMCYRIKSQDAADILSPYTAFSAIRRRSALTSPVGRWPNGSLSAATGCD